MRGMKRKNVDAENECISISYKRKSLEYTDSDGGYSSGSEISSSSYRLKKRRKQSIKKKRYDSTSSSNFSSSDIDSSSSSEDRKKKKKKQKRRKKSKRKKKKKKKKRKKKKKKRERFGTNKIKKITYEFGKHGFMTEAQKFSKAPEFTLWLLEEQNMHRDRISRRDEQEMWKKFMEEFNTSTFSDEKYYDLAKWERENATNLKDKKRKLDVWMPTNDDEILRIERKNKRAEAETAAQTQRLQHWTRELKRLKKDGSEEFKALNKKYMGDREKSTIESLARKRHHEKTRGLRYDLDEDY